MLFLILVAVAPGVAGAVLGIPLLILFGGIFLAVNLLLYPFGMGYFVPPVPTPELAGYEVVVEHQKALSELRWHVAAQREEILQGIDNQLALGDTAGAVQVIQGLKVLNDPEILRLEKVAQERMKEAQRLRKQWMQYRAEDGQTDALIRDSLAKMKEEERKRGVWQEKMAAQTAKRDAALRFLVSQKDRVGGIVWYQDRSTPPGAGAGTHLSGHPGWAPCPGRIAGRPSSGAAGPSSSEGSAPKGGGTGREGERPGRWQGSWFLSACPRGSGRAVVVGQCVGRL